MKQLVGTLVLSAALGLLFAACPSSTANTKKDEPVAALPQDAAAVARSAPTPSRPDAPAPRNSGTDDPGSSATTAQGLFREGVQMAQSNQLTVALKRFEAALKKKPSLHQAWYNIGVINDRLNNTTDAERAYKSALRLKPNFFEAALNLSRMYLRLRRTSAAMALLEQKASAYPKDLRFRNAVIYLNIYQGRLNQSEQMARAIQRQSEKNAQAVLNLGLVWYKQQKYELARMAFNIASRSRRDWAAPKYYLGFVHLKLNNRSDAIESFQKAIKLQPAHPEAYNALGVLYLKTSKVSLAKLAFEKAIQYSPRFWEAHLNLGIAMRAQQNHSGALDQFLKLAQLNPYYAETYYYLGITYLDHNLSKGRLQPAQFSGTVPPSLQKEKAIYRQLTKIARYATAVKHLQTFISRKPGLAGDAPARTYLQNALKKQTRAQKGLAGTVRRLKKRKLRMLRKKKRRRPPPPTRRPAATPPAKSTNTPPKTR